MTMHLSSALLERAVDEFSKLPGVGRKTALRYVLHLLRQDVDMVESFSNSIIRLRREVKFCNVCHNISDTDTCDICSSPSRDHKTICVVESIRDVFAIENTQQYRGLYHVLGGVISPMEGIGPSDLTISSLQERAESGDVEEVIFALSPTVEGDTTNFYIFKRLEPSGVKMSVIARGVAQNDELQYADEVTLGRSIVDRTPFKVNM